MINRLYCNYINQFSRLTSDSLGKEFLQSKRCSSKIGRSFSWCALCLVIQVVLAADCRGSPVRVGGLNFGCEFLGCWKKLGNWDRSNCKLYQMTKADKIVSDASHPNVLIHYTLPLKRYTPQVHVLMLSPWESLGVSSNRWVMTRLNWCQIQTVDTASQLAEKLFPQLS